MFFAGVRSEIKRTAGGPKHCAKKKKTAHNALDVRKRPLGRVRTERAPKGKSARAFRFTKREAGGFPCMNDPSCLPFGNFGTVQIFRCGTGNSFSVQRCRV